MKQRMKLRATGMFIISLMWVLPANALEIESHKQVMEKAVRGSSLDGYLRNNLGFENGVDQNVNGGIKVIEWVRDGSEREDDFARWLVHYFNPLKPWSEAGLAGGGASILWAQSTGNDWSWQNTRKYYFQALTSSNNAMREQNFANTFRALGQVAHLIQDLSVPAHTRNDAHVFYNYEKWVNINIGAVFGGTFISPTVSLSSSVEDLVPITQFWDTDSYVGTNPSAGTAIGLAEYTNPNFFSEDTIFTERSFPHPAKSDTNMAILEQLAEDGVLDKVSYVKHNALGHRLAAASYFRFYDPEERLLEYRWYYQLDDAVYADYASFLIPRAVGYSAALINYFFRGEVEISEIEEQRDANQAITGLKFKLKNLTPDEEMKDGEVWIAYRYKPSGDPNWKYGLSNPISSGSLPYQSEAPYEVSFSTSGSIPADAQEIQYTYVFKGTLGAEKEAVVGKRLPKLVDVIFASAYERNAAFYNRSGTDLSKIDGNVRIVKGVSGMAFDPATGSLFLGERVWMRGLSYAGGKLWALDPRSGYGDWGTGEPSYGARVQIFQSDPDVSDFTGATPLSTWSYLSPPDTIEVTYGAVEYAPSKHITTDGKFFSLGVLHQGIRTRNYLGSFLVEIPECESTVGLSIEDIRDIDRLYALNGTLSEGGMEFSLEHIMDGYDIGSHRWEWYSDREGIVSRTTFRAPFVITDDMFTACKEDRRKTCRDKYPDDNQYCFCLRSFLESPLRGCDPPGSIRYTTTGYGILVNGQTIAEYNVNLWIETFSYAKGNYIVAANVWDGRQELLTSVGKMDLAPFMEEVRYGIPLDSVYGSTSSSMAEDGKYGIYHFVWLDLNSDAPVGHFSLGIDFVNRSISRLRVEPSRAVEVGWGWGLDEGGVMVVR